MKTNVSHIKWKRRHFLIIKILLIITFYLKKNVVLAIHPNFFELGMRPAIAIKFPITDINLFRYFSYNENIKTSLFSKNKNVETIFFDNVASGGIQAVRTGSIESSFGML